MKKITKVELKKYTEMYISLESDEYFISPQVYSPLYRQLYEALMKGEEPPLTSDFKLVEHKQDFEECNTPFDRYLVAIFGSRFELSHPLPLPNEDATPEKLVLYLNARYGKTSTEVYSFNYDREKKQLLALFPKSLRPRFETGFESTCRSSWYKLFTFNYKLSTLNRQWKSFIRRADSKPDAKTLFDNVVKFNDIDSLKSRENSSLFMTLFYELDQGRPDGDDNYSRLIIMLPIALELVERAVKRKVIVLWDNAFDCEEIEDEITETFKNKNEVCSLLLKEIKPRYDVYEDINHEFYDTLMTTILKNDYYNKVLAKLSFENNLISSPEWESALGFLCQQSRWIQIKLDTNKQADKVAQALSIKSDQIDSDMLLISRMVNRLLEIKLQNVDEHILSNISLFVVAAIKHSFPSEIKGALKGAKDQFYHVYNRLSYSVHRAEERELQPWQLETVIRPSLLHFLLYCSELLIWVGKETVNDLSKFMRLRKIIYQSTLNINNELESTHHYLALYISNSFSSGQPGVDVVKKHFWEGADLSGELMKEHLNRTSYSWP